MSFRYRSKNKVLRKSIGLITAVLGVGVLFHYMPGWLWPLVVGVGLVSLGWSLFYNG